MGWMIMYVHVYMTIYYKDKYSIYSVQDLYKVSK